MQHLFAGQLPKLVLFDLDGTLVDSVPDLAQAVDKMLHALERPEVGVDQVRDWVGNGSAVLVKRALSGRMEVSEDNSAEFEQAHQLFLDFYAEATSDQSQLYPGVIDCLQRLQKNAVQMGVVTNKPIQFTESMLQGFALSDFFDVVLGGDSLVEKKPHPAPLLEAMNRCGTAPEETLMVGDSCNDVKAARAAGCAIACVPYGYNHGQPIQDANPDLIVETLDLL